MQNLFSVQVLPLMFHFKKLLETLPQQPPYSSPQPGTNETDKTQLATTATTSTKARCIRKNVLRHPHPRILQDQRRSQPVLQPRDRNQPSVRDNL